MKSKIPLYCFSLYVITFVWSSVMPVDFGVWYVEAVTSAIPVVILFVLYKRGIVLSDVAYVLATVLPVMHVIGAHYTFANVPFDWFNDLIGSERNMYDRVAHASVGFYSFAIIEVLILKNFVKDKWIAYTYAIFAIMALAALYELFEWWYAVSVDPEAGIEILGSQGDIWDAQKDMLMDTLGVLFGGVVYFVWGIKKRIR